RPGAGRGAGLRPGVGGRPRPDPAGAQCRAPGAGTARRLGRSRRAAAARGRARTAGGNRPRRRRAGARRLAAHPLASLAMAADRPAVRDPRPAAAPRPRPGPGDREPALGAPAGAAGRGFRHRRLAGRAVRPALTGNGKGTPARPLPFASRFRRAGTWPGRRMARTQSALAAATTASVVMLKYLYSSPAGAEAPKRSRPMTAPSRPTYLRQKSVTPASTATRLRTDFGSTDSR